MEFKYIGEDLRDQWEALVKANSASGFMQSFFWADLKRRTGWETFKIGVFEDKKLVGGAVILKFHFSKTKNFLYIPEGPVLPYESPKAGDYFHGLMSEVDVIANLKEEERSTHIRIDPRLDRVPEFFNKFEKAPYNMEPKNTLMVDLSEGETEILAQMKPKGRYNIKVAEKVGIEVTQDDSRKAVEEFVKIYKETVARKKFSAKKDYYFDFLVDSLAHSGSGTVFSAKYKGKTLASAVVIFYGDRATYFFGASSNTEREKMAPSKLHWEIIRYAKAKNCQWYDFWGIAPDNADPSHDWYGFTQFKKKFGGKKFTFIGAYDFIYNKKLYEDFLVESGEK